VLHCKGREGLINGERPGPGWWQESDSGWYLPEQYPQPSAARAASGPSRAVAAGPRHTAAAGPRHAAPGKRPRRYSRRWAWSALGVVTGLAALATISAGIVVVVNSNSVHIRPSEPAVLISSAPATFAAQDQIRTTPVTPAWLKDALLPTGEIGSATAARGPDTPLSHITGSCGEPALGGVRATAFESLQDSQAGRSRRETMTGWDNSADARRSIGLDREAAGQAGRCPAGSDGVTGQVPERGQ
jgi:hypothetical protein